MNQDQTTRTHELSGEFKLPQYVFTSVNGIEQRRMVVLAIVERLGQSTDRIYLPRPNAVAHWLGQQAPQLFALGKDRRIERNDSRSVAVIYGRG